MGRAIRLPERGQELGDEVHSWLGREVQYLAKKTKQQQQKTTHDYAVECWLRRDIRTCSVQSLDRRVVGGRWRTIQPFFGRPLWTVLAWVEHDLFWKIGLVYYYFQDHGRLKKKKSSKLVTCFANNDTGSPDRKFMLTIVTTVSWLVCCVWFFFLLCV